MIDISKKECYKTVSRTAESTVIEKRSRFIATVKPCQTEQEALDFLAQIKKKYSDANHNVYAYVIDENNIFRYSDDGEPQGTAGMPVLDTIRKSGIVDCAVVVTRYFGGTLLGTGGLVRAYGKTAHDGLNAAGVVVRRLCDVVEVKAEYTLSGKIEHFISQQQFMCDMPIYANDVTYTLYIPKDKTDKLKNDLQELTNARAYVKITGEKYKDEEDLI